MSNKFNEKEWKAAVYLAYAILDLPKDNGLDITSEDIRNAAFDLLHGLIDRSEGRQPQMPKRTRIVIDKVNAAIKKYTEMEQHTFNNLH